MHEFGGEQPFVVPVRAQEERLALVRVCFGDARLHGAGALHGSSLAHRGIDPAHVVEDVLCGDERGERRAGGLLLDCLLKLNFHSGLKALLPIHLISEIVPP